MKVNVRHHENVSVLDLTGRMAIPEEVDVREAVTSLIKKGRTQILLNLKGVPWMDSTGLGELIACLKRVRERGGVIKLLKPTRRVYDVLQLTRLNEVFDIFDDEQNALGSFTSGN